MFHPLEFCEDSFCADLDTGEREYRKNPLSIFVPSKWDSDFLKDFPYQETIKQYFITTNGINILFETQEGLLSFLFWYGKPEEYLL